MLLPPLRFAVGLTLLPLVRLSVFCSASRLLRSPVDVLDSCEHSVGLDLSSFYNECGINYSCWRFGSGVRSFILPREHYHITSVVYGATLVYDPLLDKGDAVSWVLMTKDLEHLLIRVSCGSRNLYFTLSNGSCVRISPKEYHFTMARISGPSRLDISTFDGSTEIGVAKHSGNGFFLARYRANPGFRIDSVVDGHVPIWSADDSGAYCSGVLTYNRESRRFVQVVVEGHDSTTRVYYLGENGTYRSLLDAAPVSSGYVDRESSAVA